MAMSDMMAQGGPPASIDLPPQGGGDQAPSDQPEAAPDLESAAKQALQIMNSALASPDNDPEEANAAEAATSALTKILAMSQKNSDAAMGIGPAHKAVRKAAKKSGGAQGGY